jgi:hypothetical protein
LNYLTIKDVLENIINYKLTVLNAHRAVCTNRCTKEIRTDGKRNYEINKQTIEPTLLLSTPNLRFKFRLVSWIS